MTRLLHIDASVRPDRDSHGSHHSSHTRALSARFVAHWKARAPHDDVVYRDVGAHPPAPVSQAWVRAAFTPQQRRDAAMHATLAQSDAIVDEVLAADVIVAGVPMYNFGPPAQFKAYIDNLVRVGRTFGFDRARSGEPYWPMLAGQGKQLVILTSRGDAGYGPGGRLQASNHVESSIRTAFAYMGIDDMRVVAVEYDEFGDERLQASLNAARAEVDALADAMLAQRATQASHAA